MRVLNRVQKRAQSGVHVLSGIRALNGNGVRVLSVNGVRALNGMGFRVTY